MCHCQRTVRTHGGMSAAMSSTCDEELPPPLECARLRRRPLGCDPGSWWPRPVLGEASPWEGDWATGVAAPLATPAWGDAMFTSPPVDCLRPAVLPDLVLLPADSAVPAQVRSVRMSTPVAQDLALADLPPSRPARHTAMHDLRSNEIVKCFMHRKLVRAPVATGPPCTLHAAF